MKIVLSILFFFSLLLNADEIQRIESMVKDISQLKNEYNSTEQKLQQCSNRLQNSIVKESNFEKKEKKYLKRIKYLEHQLLISKKTKKIDKKRKSVKPIKCLINQKLEEPNPFPKLKMKKQFTPQNRVEFFKASSFRVDGEAKIYNGINADIIATWEDKTSFTSNQKEGDWIKITGYFVDKQWQASDKDIWIKSANVVKRNGIKK